MFIQRACTFHFLFWRIKCRYFVLGKPDTGNRVVRFYNISSLDNFIVAGSLLSSDIGDSDLARSVSLGVLNHLAMSRGIPGYIYICEGSVHG